MPTARPRYRLLALDVDGTLLDRAGVLRPATIAAVRRAAGAGILPVLCTGRRYRRARPIALRLGLDAPIVCNSGALVKEPFHHRTLWRADLDEATIRGALAIFADAGHPCVSFTDHGHDGADFLVEGYPLGHGHHDDYVGKNRPHAAIVPGWRDGPLDAGHFHLCAIGDRDAMHAADLRIVEALGGRVRTFVQRSPAYTGTMCEVIRADASKWTALLHIAADHGIEPAEIAAIGDDMNDLPMIAAAALGVAMGHAPTAVREAADLVVADHDGEGVAELVGRLLGD